MFCFVFNQMHYGFYYLFMFHGIFKIRHENEIFQRLCYSLFILLITSNFLSRKKICLSRNYISGNFLKMFQVRILLFLNPLSAMCVIVKSVLRNFLNCLSMQSPEELKRFKK